MAGSNYRPICDVWLLARTKKRYYGAYPEGFLWRARVLVPGRVVHLCGGTIRPTDQDYTVDLDPGLCPSLVADARGTGLPAESFDGCLIDPPYSEDEIAHYGCVHDYPKPGDLLREGYRLVRPGGRVGMLHLVVPRPPAPEARLVAIIGVVVGYGNRIRVFVVFEKPMREEAG